MCVQHECGILPEAPTTGAALALKQQNRNTAAERDGERNITRYVSDERCRNAPFKEPFD